MSIPTNLLDIPPFQFQSLIPGVVTDNGGVSESLSSTPLLN